MADETKEVLTIADAARIYKTSVKVVYRNYHSWPHFHVGKSARFFRDELDEHFRKVRDAKPVRGQRKFVIPG